MNKSLKLRQLKVDISKPFKTKKSKQIMNKLKATLCLMVYLPLPIVSILSVLEYLK